MEKVVKSATLVIFLTFLMKISSFIKQVMIANTFGTSSEIDIYLLSTDMLGDFSNALFSSLSVSLLTHYATEYASGKENEANSVLASSYLFFFPLSLLCATLFYFFSVQIASVVARYYSENLQTLSARYIQIICPTIPFLCLTYLDIAVLDSHHVFWPGRLINFTLSVSLIASILIFRQQHGTLVLCYAYMFAYFLHMLIVRAARLRVRRLHLKNAFRAIHLKSVSRMFLPILIGNAAVEINALIDKYIASSFGSGFLSAQTYGATLNSFVNSILISSPTGVLFAHFTVGVASKDKHMNALLENSFLWMTFLLVPVTVVTLISRLEIVQIIYQRGAFNATDAINTSRVLTGYAFGFVFSAVGNILVKIHLSRKDSRNVMFNGLIATCVNIVSSVFLARRIGLMGISVGSSVSSLCGMLLNLRSGRVYLKALRKKFLWREASKILIAGAFSALCAWTTRHWFAGGSAYASFLSSVFSVFTVFLLTLFLLNSQIFAELLRALESVRIRR